MVGSAGFMRQDEATGLMAERLRIPVPPAREAVAQGAQFRDLIALPVEAVGAPAPDASPRPAERNAA
jgi:hypothetical protein